MPDWAIVLVAAFGGGLAGAVLEPLASHILQMIRSAKEIRKKRERSLRRMLNAHFALGQELESVWAVVQFQTRSEQPLTSANRGGLVDQSVAKVAPKPGATWLPERIPDADLRNLALEYHGRLVDLTFTLAEQPYDEEKADLLVDRLDELKRQIVLRMDQLNWPEVDE